MQRRRDLKYDFLASLHLCVFARKEEKKEKPLLYHGHLPYYPHSFFKGATGFDGARGSLVARRGLLHPRKKAGKNLTANDNFALAA